MPRKAKQAVTVAPSSQYGQAAAQEASQKAIPLPQTQLPPSLGASAVSSSSSSSTSPQASPLDPNAAAGLTLPPSLPPGSIGPLDAPSDRPLEHVMTGAPIGGGAGPEALSLTPDADAAIRLRALYSQFPSEDLADLIEAMDER